MVKKESSTPIFLLAREYVSEFLYNEISEISTLSINEDNKDLKRIIEFIIRIKRDINFYTISEEIEFEDIWEYVRGSEIVTDFVFNITNELVMSIGVENFNELCNEISSAYSSNKMPHSAIDDVVLERLPNENGLLEMLENNSWIVPLYIIRHCDISDLIKK